MAADESGHNGIISRQALGRTASLGDIYDATTDTFSHMSIFRKQLPADCGATTKTDTPDSNISYVSVRCLKEMFNKLNVTGELKLSVLAGMCELDGSAKYLSEKKSTCKAVESTLLYNIRTVTERLELSNRRVKKYISKKVLRKSVGTHVVIEIEWGASCGVTVTDQYREETQRQEVEGIIRMIFRKLMAFIPTPGNVGGENAQEEAAEWQRFSIEVFGDVVTDFRRRCTGLFRRISTNFRRGSGNDEKNTGTDSEVQHRKGQTVDVHHGTAIASRPKNTNQTAHNFQKCWRKLDHKKCSDFR